MSLSPIKERYQRAWHEGMDELLTKLASPAAELALAEGLSDKKAAEAARLHMRSLAKVRAHFKDEHQMWLKGHGPERAVALAKSNLKEHA